MMSSAPQPSPDDLNAMFSKACEAHMEGRLKEAKSLYEEILSYVQAPLLHYNLGLIHYEYKEFSTALPHFDAAVKGNPDDIDSLFNLALCLKKCSKIEEAISLFENILKQEEQSSDALYNLAGCYRESKNNDKAIETYLRVLEIKPDHSSATNNLAYMYHLTGDTEKAIFYFEKVLLLNPGHAAAAHMLASLQGQASQSSPESYVKDVFDNYSDHYEKSLVDELQYAVPIQLRELFNSLADVPEMFSSGIDLGCGTGLSGQSFADIVNEFDGIDLSENMLKIAADKNVYNSLFTGNIIEYLRSTKKEYDFYIAADVFNYIGNLQEVFTLACKRAMTNGRFCFSTETTTGDSFVLQSTGRFAHSPGYVLRTAEEAGWSIELQQQANLRLERGTWIKGALWILKH